jgi:hypothetical protein
MTYEVFFLLKALYLLGFMGSFALMAVFQGAMDRQQFIRVRVTIACIALAWPVLAVALPVSVGLLMMLALISGEWREMFQ